MADTLAAPRPEDGALSEVAKEDARSYNRIVWDLAWPAIALNSLQVVNSLLDSKFVGMIGPNSLAASGGALSIVFMLFSIAFALGTGTTALVSRFYGADEPHNLTRASRQAISLGLILGVLFAAIGAATVPYAALLFAPREDPVYRELLRYMYPVMAGIPAVFAFNTVAASLRAVGDTKRPMYVSGFQILLHIALNILLIFPTRDVSLLGNAVRLPGAGLGIAGAGWAFAISAWVAAFAYFPVAGHTVLGAVWRLQVVSVGWAMRILRIAAPAGLAATIRVTSLAAFASVLQHTAEGTSALGAMRVGFSMEGLAFMPAFGYMVAASALVGQSLGMRSPDRAERLGWSATNQAVLFMSAMSIVFLVFAPQLAGFFTEDPGQRANAALFLRIIAITEPLFGYALVLTGAHQGAGDTVGPTWVSLITLWGVRVPAVWVFAVVLGGDSAAAWWVMSFTQALSGILMIWLFKQGRWKHKKV